MAHMGFSRATALVLTLAIFGTSFATGYDPVANVDAMTKTIQEIDQGKSLGGRVHIAYCDR
eukprot:gene2096-18154_t